LSPVIHVKLISLVVMCTHYLLQSTQMTVVVTIVRKPLSLPRSCSQYFVTEEHTNLTYLTAVTEGSIWTLSSHNNEELVSSHS